MASKLEVANKMYQSVLEEVPYSSAALMHALSGNPPQFGGICLTQSQVLRARLFEAGIADVQFLRDTDKGMHHPLLVTIEGQSFYADPYLMLPSLVSLDAVRASYGKHAVFPSFPHVDGQPSLLHISTNVSGSQLTVFKTWPKSSRTDRFTYDLTSSENQELTREDLHTLLKEFPPQHLSIRTLDVNVAETDHVVYPLHSPLEVSAERLYVLTNAHNRIDCTQQGFHNALELIAQRLHTPATAVIGFMTEAVQRYATFLELSAP